MKLCPIQDFTLWKGQCYSFQNTDLQTWHNARRICLAKSTGTTNVDLVSILSAEENAYVYRQLKTSKQRGYWIGYQRQRADGKSMYMRTFR